MPEREPNRSDGRIRNSKTYRCIDQLTGVGLMAFKPVEKQTRPGTTDVRGFSREEWSGLG